jgi:excinuclease ABC subunit C
MANLLNKTIPALPGVYLFKDAQETVVYIGKAKSLKSRVASYFQDHNTDWKVDAILQEYADLEFIITKNETEALLLEAELIQKYQPKLNTLLKDGQPFLYIWFAPEGSSPRKGKKVKKLPSIEIVRNKKKKGGTYFGPFFQKIQTRKVYNYLIRTFALNICNKTLENGCLDYHLGNCAGTCMPHFNRDGYEFRRGLAMDVLKNQHLQFLKKIEDQIKYHNQRMEFEHSKLLQEYIENFDTIFETIRTKYSAAKFATDIIAATTTRNYVADINETAQLGLQKMLKLPAPIRIIDCFDISHFQSHYIVGSCVRFVDGKPDKNKFRRFQIRTLDQQDDYSALREIVSRRYKDTQDLPDLILIDGGKGQLNAVQDLFPQAHFASLAKREERLYSNNNPDGLLLDIKTDAGKLLIALRDYAHHFAISYHRLRRSKGLANI